MKVKPIWLSLIVIVCFLFVHGGYNHPVDPIYTGLLWVLEKYGFTFTLEDLPLQFIIVASFLIITSILGKKALVIAGIIVLMLLLAFWIYMLSGSIEFDYISMVPFVVSCIVSIIILLRKTQDTKISKS